MDSAEYHWLMSEVTEDEEQSNILDNNRSAYRVFNSYLRLIELPKVCVSFPVTTWQNYLLLPLYVFQLLPRPRCTWFIFPPFCVPLLSLSDAPAVAAPVDLSPVASTKLQDFLSVLINDSFRRIIIPETPAGPHSGWCSGPNEWGNETQVRKTRAAEQAGRDRWHEGRRRAVTGQHVSHSDSM